MQFYILLSAEKQLVTTSIQNINIHFSIHAIDPQACIGKILCSIFIVEALPGVLGIQGEGYLFSGIWEDGSFIFRDLGRKHGFREQGAGGLRENISGTWGEMSFFCEGAGSKDPPTPGGPHC